MKNFSQLVLIVLMLFATVMNLHAQEETEEETEKSPLEISGFVDVYYQYNFNGNTPDLTSFTSGNNSFELGMANIVFAKQIGKVGFVADLAFGPRANAANGTGGATIDPIKQLYITYAPTDWLTLTAGNYGTHVGYEIIDANGNFNYSTSYLFSYGPFFHTGVKADFVLSDEVGLMVGIFDDTDSKTDFLPGKHVGAQLSYSKGKLNAYLNYLGGSAGNDTLTGHQVDLTATYQASEKFLIGLNTSSKTVVVDSDLLPSGENAQWFGAALYLNYNVSETFALGFRGEYFDDADAIALGLGNVSVIDLTLSANLKSGPFTFIPEVRVDLASEDIFVGSEGAATGISPTVIGAVIYSF